MKNRHLSTLVFALGCLSASCLASYQLMAQEQVPEPPDTDTITQAPSTQTSNSSSRLPEFDAALELDYQQAEGQDAPDELRRDTSQVEVDLTLGVHQPLGNSVSLVSQLQLSTLRFDEDSLNTDDSEFFYDLERLYLQFRPSKSLRLRIGRQGFSDVMETILDEDLDGAAIRYDYGRARVELSFTREDWFEASTFERDDNITNTLLSLRFDANKDSTWMPYILTRTEEELGNNAAGERTWIGLQGIIEPADSAFRYWVHGISFTGKEDDGDDDLGGLAVDLGLNLYTRGAFDTVFTLAVASATGGDPDKRFRQTGLQDNDFALNDKNKFRYLGEALDPELTNLRIYTLGIGAEFGKQWQADIAMHRYEQVEAEDALRGTDIEFEPLGVSTDLGTGVDIVLAYVPSRSFAITGTASTFMPGEAFADNQDPATLFRLEIDYRF